MVSNGADDWYLPARDELFLLYDSLVDVDGDDDPNTPTPGYQYGFQADRYYSSTENSIGSALGARFDGDGTVIGISNHNSDRGSRCVRKGPAPRGANPDGLEGEMIYNSTHDVVQFCDGARWRAIGK